MKRSSWILGILAFVFVTYFIREYFHINQYFCAPILIHELGYEIRFPQTFKESIREYNIKERNKSATIDDDTIITAYEYHYSDNERFIFNDTDSTKAESIYSLNFLIKNKSQKEIEDLMKDFSEKYQSKFQKTEQTRYGKKDTYYYYKADIEGCISITFKINDYNPLPLSAAKNQLYISFFYLLNSGEVHSAAMNNGILDKSPYGI